MKNVAARLLLLLASGVVAPGACAPLVQPIDVMSGCPEMPVRGPEEYAFAPPETVIDDFEDGDLKLMAVAGRMGSWVGFATLGASVFGESSSRCAARGLRAGHLTSMAPVGVTYAANWNAVMIDPFSEAQAWDASAYSGFSFWIATGTSSPFETPIGVSTVDTLPAGGVCSNPAGCNDYYAIRKPDRTFTLTSTWTRHVFKFADLKQFGFGVPLVPLNKSKLVSLLIWPEKPFDIWIDDVRFEP